MKCFSLLSVAAFLAVGLTAQADQLPSVTAAPGDTSDVPSYLAPVAPGVDTDFPGYPPGFTSYRGLGFMGSCCQPCSPRAQHAWDGYCEGMESWEPAPWQGFFAKFQGWMRPPAWTCGPKCCDPCGGPRVKSWPVAPACHEPLCVKLQRLRSQWAGMFGGCRASSCCDAYVEDGEAWESAKIPAQKSAEPIPQPAAPEAPAPQTTGEIRPNRLSLPALDRSAWRSSLWQWPGSRDGF